MALLWFDGFETYSALADWLVVENPLFTPIDSGPVLGQQSGRRGGYDCGIGTNNTWWGLTFNDNYATLISGFAMKRTESGNPTVAYNYGVFQVLDGSTLQLGFCPDVNGEIQVYRGDNTLLGTTSGANLVLNVWSYLEFKFTIHSSAGVVEVRVDGRTVLSLTGQNTQNSGNAYCNVIRIADIYSALSTRYDDFYVLDTTGSKNNDFLGDVRIDVIRPDGAGTYTTFTPSAGSNYQNVDEVPGPDDDSTYNDGDTPGNKDSYAMGSLEALGTTIHGVKTQMTARKTDAGSKYAKLLTKSGTTEILSQSLALSESWRTQAGLFENNPDDSNAWEEADVNAMEVGIQIATTTTTSTTSTTTTTA